MAAGQQKKRLISNSLPEHYKEKKKKRLKSSEYALNLRPQPYLEMNEKQETTFGKSEQIGITRKDMGPYIDSTRKHRSGLADVICVPKEIYDLDNLRDVLSYEVWSTCLSDSERNLITQFLPAGMDTEQVVHSLLSGENHHFGNASSIWSSLLCSGSLHPDAVLRKERQTKFNKKLYYPELHKYHTNMIERLKILKAQWKSSKESEVSKELIKSKARSLPASSAKVKEPPQKVQIRVVDTSKYMSYIKITKKQHEAIKSNLRSSGDAIQSKSISRVLGDIKNFPVHPYDELEKEDKRLLHERWLQVVNKDLPVAFEEHNGKVFKREELMKRLEIELSEKQALILDKELPVVFEEHTENILKREVMKSLEQELSEKQTLIPDKVDDACKIEVEQSPKEMVQEEEVDDQNGGDVLIPNIAISASFNSDMGLISTIDKEPPTTTTHGILFPEEKSPLVSHHMKESPLVSKTMWQPVLDNNNNHLQSISTNNFNMGNNNNNNNVVFSSYPPYPKPPEMLLSYPPQFPTTTFYNHSSSMAQFPNRSSYHSIYNNNNNHSIYNHRVSSSNNNSANFWPGVGASSSTDGSLYSVLNTTPNGNYGGYIHPQFGGSAVSNSSSSATVLPTTTLNNALWMNGYQPQQEMEGKPYVRPWNQ